MNLKDAKVVGVLRTKGGSGESYGCALVANKFKEIGYSSIIVNHWEVPAYTSGWHKEVYGVNIVSFEEALNYSLSNMNWAWEGLDLETILQKIAELPDHKWIFTRGTHSGCTRNDVENSARFCDLIYVTARDDVIYTKEQALNITQNLSGEIKNRVFVLLWFPNRNHSYRIMDPKEFSDYCS